MQFKIIWNVILKRSIWSIDETFTDIISSAKSWWGSSSAGALGNMEHLFIAIAPRSTLARSGSTW